MFKTVTDRRQRIATPSVSYIVGGPAKRLFDVVTASFLLVFLAPFLLLVALLMKLFDPGAAIYSQMRVGQGGTRFSCFKFRTMVENSDEILKELLQNDPVAAKEWDETHKLRNDVRITRIGKFMRETSLDELPQLINVIRGDMSLVGPRPIVEAELVHYGRRAETYRQARPGLTGLWQVSGRSNTSYRRRVCLDVYYITHWSFLQDITILYRTLGVVLMRKGSV